MTSIPQSAMGLSALAERAGVPVGTVKYYLREGLLPEGRLRSTNRADYTEEHLRRLRLLRLLREVGDVPVDRLQGLVAALESDDEDHLRVLDHGSRAMAHPAPAAGPHGDHAADLAADLLARAGWTWVAPDSPSLESLRVVLEALVTWEHEGPPLRPDLLLRYAEAADAIGRDDIASLDAEDPAGMLAQLVVGQVVYGRLLDVLRRLAEEHHSVLRFAATPGGGGRAGAP